MADHYTYLDANGHNIGPIGKITGEVLKPRLNTSTSTVTKKMVATPVQKTVKPKKGLKPLAKWNEEVYAARLKPKGTGLACPTCGQELYDTNPGEMKYIGTSVSTPVHCSNNGCFFRSFREC